MRELSLETHEINLRVGDTHKSQIGGLGSAGYGWDYAVEGDPDIVTVSIESLPPPLPPPPGGTPPDTYSAEQLVVITAEAPGEATVRLLLRRPWEHDKPALREIRFEISISQ